MTNKLSSSFNKIILVSEFVDKRSNSTGYYWEKITNIYAMNGCEVSVISTEHSNTLSISDFENIRRYSVSHKKPLEKGSLFLRLMDQIKLSFSFAKILNHIAGSEHIVISGTNPPLMLYLIMVLRGIRKFRWAVLVHDVFPDNLVPAGILSRDSALLSLLRFIFGAVYRRADKLIAIGRDMSDMLQRKGVSGDKIVYIPNFVDLDELHESTNYWDSRTVPGPGKGGLTFSFFGNLGRVQGIEVLLEAIDKVLSPDASFLFIGDGVHSNLVDEFCADRTQCRRIDALPFSSHAKGLLEGDVAIVSLAPEMYGLGVPSKTYFSLGVGKPILVIGDKGSELHRLLERHPSAGWFCEAGSSEQIATTIDLICRSTRLPDKDALRSIVSEEYSYNSAEEQYLKLIAEFTNDEGIRPSRENIESS